MSQKHLFFFFLENLESFTWQLPVEEKGEPFFIVFLNVQPTVLQLEFWPISEDYTSVLFNCPEVL